MSQTRLIEDGFSLADQNQGFAQHMGPFYQKQCTGNPRQYIRALAIEPQHLNPEQVVNGGVSLAFMDYAIYRAIGDDIGHQIQFATINLNSQFLAAAKLGECLYGRGKIVRKTRSVIFAEGEIYTAQRPIMNASGIWKIIGQ